METKKLKVGAGDNFDSVAKKAKELAIEMALIVEFDFNGVCCFVNANTNLDFLYRDYANSWTMEWKFVGPDCVKKYSAEVEADFKKRTKIREEKAAKEDAKYRAKEEKEKKEFEARVKGIEIELSDAEAWKKSRDANTDGYGAAALDYAEGWAKMMQIEIANGKTIAQCYDYSQNGLGFLGITGFQFGCAVSILSQTWKHGEELRKVHNKKYGIGEDKKGVVNPAILTIGK